MHTLALLALAGCSGQADPPDEATTPSPTEPTGADTSAPGHTGHTAVPDTGWVPPGPELAVTVTRFEGCPATVTYPYDTQLVATSPGAGEVQFAFEGLLYGCTCESGSLTAWTEGSTEIGVNLHAGDCDASLCCAVEATLTGVSEGTWTVTVEEGSRPAATVTVP